MKSAVILSDPERSEGESKDLRLLFDFATIRTNSILAGTIKQTNLAIDSAHKYCPRAPSFPRFLRKGWETSTLFKGRINSMVNPKFVAHLHEAEV
jgi:hypothetical protein